ncbi:hypothetical protein BDZ45DRAFT_327487 [Acephala macrosclerotiorum]|nr:hypothetical protein BDZ45DRAFT_327487 [Acephala macrosclerotiorum]
MSGVEAAIGFGATVLGIAGAGVSVATTLIRFSVSYKGSTQKIEDLSSPVSLTATILTTVDKAINSHHDYFKEDNFREKFNRVIERCKNDYEVLGAAVQKAKGEVEKTESARWEGKMTSWKKLLWALGGEERMQDLQSSLEESKTQVLMMQSAASLIVLQIIGRR